ncbi:40S ribosomal protein S9-2 [Acorus calamus]|uniref:40S ribosomal protein S9-2 n=1 Tax=Acorus calamus TaxID=4465 RepID=A0AAV9DCU3_ACOCL|nr:40S ribosomal protein S9-2 [Acorus calamus]
MATNPTCSSLHPIDPPLRRQGPPQRDPPIRNISPSSKHFHIDFNPRLPFFGTANTKTTSPCMHSSRIRNAVRELLILEEKNMWRIVEGEALLRKSGMGWRSLIHYARILIK